MENQITIHLTDDEYTALREEARQSGQEIEALIRELLEEIVARQKRAARRAKRPQTKREVSELLYDTGLTEHIPSGRIPSEEEEAERKHLADLFSQIGGKPASEMVIEDRGPY
jgi:SpoVK/Ycf46/Vps4 family AAA+-type ATPase